MRPEDLQIVFRGLDHSEAVVEAIGREAAKLFRLHDRFTSGTITIEAIHRQNNRWSMRYVVHLTMHSPDLGEIVVTHETGEGAAKPDVFLAVRDAFDTALRQVKDRRERLLARAKS